MPRINPIESTNSDPKAAELLAGVKKALGVTPNMMTTMAQSPAVLESYLSFSGALAKGSLGGKLGEQIALAVAGANGCGYCASAHTLLGSKHGVPEDELQRNLRGEASDDRTQAAIDFARTLVIKRGWAADADLTQIRNAGFTEGQIAEIVAHVALNTFTNYFNHVADPDIDFPKVEVGAPAPTTAPVTA